MIWKESFQSANYLIERNQVGQFMVTTKRTWPTTPKRQRTKKEIQMRRESRRALLTQFSLWMIYFLLLLLLCFFFSLSNWTHLLDWQLAQFHNNASVKGATCAKDMRALKTQSTERTDGQNNIHEKTTNCKNQIWFIACNYDSSERTQNKYVKNVAFTFCDWKSSLVIGSCFFGLRRFVTKN